MQVRYTNIQSVQTLSNQPQYKYLVDFISLVLTLVDMQKLSVRSEGTRLGETLQVFIQVCTITCSVCVCVSVCVCAHVCILEGRVIYIMTYLILTV